MRATLIVTLVLHFLSGVFWAGTTFALARTGANQTDQFFRPQMGAAVIVVATGGLLWYLVHPGSFGTILPWACSAHSLPPASRAYRADRPSESSPSQADPKRRDCAIAWQQASASPQLF